MKPSVVLFEGRHITAADKRSILDGIEHLRETFARFVQASPETVPNYADQWLRRGRSRKRYSIAPCPSLVNRYRVTVRETYTNDYGAKRHSDMSITVDVKGLAPLHHPRWNELICETIGGRMA